MLVSSEIRHGRHCVFQLHVHLVFVTKYRKKIFDADAVNRLRAIFTKVCGDFEAEMVLGNRFSVLRQGLVFQVEAGCVP